jgi:hypothetical protein
VPFQAASPKFPSFILSGFWGLAIQWTSPCDKVVNCWCLLVGEMTWGEGQSGEVLQGKLLWVGTGAHREHWRHLLCARCNNYIIMCKAIMWNKPHTKPVRRLACCGRGSWHFEKFTNLCGGWGKEVAEARLKFVCLIHWTSPPFPVAQTSISRRLEVRLSQGFSASLIIQVTLDKQKLCSLFWRVSNSK